MNTMRLYRFRIAPEQDASWIRRSKVSSFWQKGEDFVFKISNGDHEPIMLSAEEALKLFEASPDEKPFATTEGFDRLYQQVKLLLFRSDTKNRNDKNILKAIQKLNAIKMKLPEDYYSDLWRLSMRKLCLAMKCVSSIK